MNILLEDRDQAQQGTMQVDMQSGNLGQMLLDDLA